MRWHLRRPRRRGWLESGLFKIMGPAQIGDLRAPVTYIPPLAALRCHKCAALWEDHKVVRTAHTTIAHCPREQAK